ncbi:MAG: hypothetical protein ABJA79_08420, partial [Parafilimonas sp.]
ADVSGYLKSSRPAAVEQTADGGYIIAGSIYSVFGFDDVYILKTDSDGNIQWHKVYGGTGYDKAADVHQTSTGEYIVVASTESFGVGSPYSPSLYALKLSAAGDSIWTKTYNYSSDDYADAAKVKELADGNFIVCGTGYLNSFPDDINAMLLKINSSNGDVLWSKSYGGAQNYEFCYDVKQTNDGGFIMAGRARINFSQPDCFLMKIDATGNSIQWVKT